MWFEQFSTVKFDDFSVSTKWDLWLAIGLEGLGYGVVFWARGNYLNTETESVCNISSSPCNFGTSSSSISFITSLTSTLQMTLTFVKFSIITLIFYSIFVIGDFS